jgi:hypothetical protein
MSGKIKPTQMFESIYRLIVASDGTLNNNFTVNTTGCCSITLWLKHNFPNACCVDLHVAKRDVKFEMRSIHAVYRLTLLTVRTPPVTDRENSVCSRSRICHQASAFFVKQEDLILCLFSVNIPRRYE